MEANLRQTATILAALRFWQDSINRNHGVSPHDALDDIASDGQQFAPLTPDEIDTLCEQINARDLSVSDIDRAVQHDRECSTGERDECDDAEPAGTLTEMEIAMQDAYRDAW